MHLHAFRQIMRSMFLSMIFDHRGVCTGESVQVCMCHGDKHCKYWIVAVGILTCIKSSRANGLDLGILPLLMCSTNLSLIERKKKKYGRQEREQCKGQPALQPDAEIYNPPNSPSLWQHVFTDSHYLY